MCSYEPFECSGRVEKLYKRTTEIFISQCCFECPQSAYSTSGHMTTDVFILFSSIENSNSVTVQKSSECAVYPSISQTPTVTVMNVLPVLHGSPPEQWPSLAASCLRCSPALVFHNHHYQKWKASHQLWLRPNVWTRKTSKEWRKQRAL